MIKKILFSLIFIITILYFQFSFANNNLSCDDGKCVDLKSYVCKGPGNIPWVDISKKLKDNDVFFGSPNNDEKKSIRELLVKLNPEHKLQCEKEGDFFLNFWWHPDILEVSGETKSKGSQSTDSSAKDKKTKTEQQIKDEKKAKEAEEKRLKEEAERKKKEEDEKKEKIDFSTLSTGVLETHNKIIGNDATTEFFSTKTVLNLFENYKETKEDYDERLVLSNDVLNNLNTQFNNIQSILKELISTKDLFEKALDNCNKLSKKKYEYIDKKRKDFVKTSCQPIIDFEKNSSRNFIALTYTTFTSEFGSNPDTISKNIDKYISELKDIIETNYQKKLNEQKEKEKKKREDKKKKEKAEEKRKQEEKRKEEERQKKIEQKKKELEKQRKEDEKIKQEQEKQRQEEERKKEKEAQASAEVNKFNDQIEKININSFIEDLTFYKNRFYDLTLINYEDVNIEFEFKKLQDEYKNFKNLPDNVLNELLSIKEEINNSSVLNNESISNLTNKIDGLLKNIPSDDDTINKYIEQINFNISSQIPDLLRSLDKAKSTNTIYLFIVIFIILVTGSVSIYLFIRQRSLQNKDQDSSNSSQETINLLHQEIKVLKDQLRNIKLKADYKDPEVIIESPTPKPILNEPPDEETLFKQQQTQLNFEYFEAITDPNKISSFMEKWGAIGVIKESKVGSSNYTTLKKDTRLFDQCHFWAVPIKNHYHIFVGRALRKGAVALTADAGRGARDTFAGIFNVEYGSSFQVTRPAKAIKKNQIFEVTVQGVIELPRNK